MILENALASYFPAIPDEYTSAKSSDMLPRALRY